MQATEQITYSKLVEVTDQKSFTELKDEWNALVEVTVNEPYHRHEFVKIWIDNFAPNARLRILTLRNEFGRLVAILPLIEETSLFCGMPIRQLIATANTHSSRFDLIALDREAASERIFQYLMKDRNWTLIKLIDVPETGSAWNIANNAKKQGFPVGIWESQSPPYIDLPASYNELMNRLDTKFKGNLRRREKQLQSLGEITLEKVTTTNNLDNYLSEAFQIEMQSWKGKNGTGVAQDQQIYKFYRELAYAAAENNYLRLYFLKLNGKAIAFHYGLSYANVYSMPKTGFDEFYKNCSPGHLLLSEVLKDCIEQGITKLDFLGDSVGPHMDWKMKWSSGVNTHKWIHIFRNNSLGQALCKAKFNWLPAAKQVCSKFIGRDFGMVRHANMSLL